MLKKQMVGLYEIVDRKPEFYDRAVETFGIDWDKYICFTAYPFIHIKGGKIEKKNADLLEHELVHIRQQMNYPGGTEAWWERYFTDGEWRLEQELEAYRHQYKYVVRNYPGGSHLTCLRWYARCLMSIYAIPDMTEIKAMNLIKS